MIVIVDHVMLKDEEGNKETIVKTAEGIQQDIKGLLRCDLWWFLIPILRTRQHSWDNR